MAPDFYPVHLLPDSSLAAAPTVAQPVLVVSSYTPTPTMQILTPIQLTATPLPESTPNRAPPTPLATTPPASSQLSTDIRSIENTDSSTDVEESATTTSKEVTLSTTSMGVDETTTVTTKHPTTTRPRGSQNTSGAQSGQSRGKIMRGPRIGSTLGYLGGLMASSAGWQAVIVAMVNPRGQLEKVETRMAKAAWAMAKRAEGAHVNGLETLPVYYGAVLAALHAGVAKDQVNFYTGLFLASRALYNVVYILNTNQFAALARTFIWTTSLGACLKLFLAAAATKY
ncbi:hypothetical protein BGZ51_004401 [Haplosporangium sp. Z 767]|nr:hypothetical protein BGZ51_004401 [Haplosporangium sp. Z 767]